MTLKSGVETGRGCCRDCVKGHCALHRPMLNKVSINSSFIGDHNQCITDGGGQLKLSTEEGAKTGGQEDGRTEEQRTGKNYTRLQENKCTDKMRA